MELNEFKIIYAQVARWALPFLLLLLLFLAFNCTRQNTENKQLSQSLQTNLERTKQLENQKGEMVAQNNVLFTGNQRDLRALTDTIFNLKDREERLIRSVLSYSKIVQEASFKNKAATFDDRPTVNEKGDTVFMPQPTDPDLIRVPRSFGYSDSTIFLSGKVRKADVLIDSVKIPNVLSIRTAEVKSGIFKRSTVVQAINSNPAFKNTGIATVEVKHKPTAWNRWVKPVLFAAAGVFIGSQIK